MIVKFIAQVCSMNINRWGVFEVIFRIYKYYIFAFKWLGEDLKRHHGVHIECIYGCICSYVLRDTIYS